jgi:hypothetical protein
MKDFLLYAAGVVTGIAIGGYVFKKKYEEIMEEDRQSRKEVYEREQKEESTKEEEKEEPKQASSVAPVNPDISEYKKTIKKQGYNHSEVEDADYEMIPARDFDSLEDYSSVTLTMYPNGEIRDDQDDILSEDEIAAAIGSRNALTDLTDYGEEAVYIRNHGRQVDYEVIREEEDYE